MVGGLHRKPLVRGSDPSDAGEVLPGWGSEPHMSNQGTPWCRYTGRGINETHKCLCTCAIYENHEQGKPSDPYGTGHPGLGNTSLMGQSPSATSHPANYWQKVVHMLPRQLKLREGLTKSLGCGTGRPKNLQVAQLMRVAVGGAKNPA